MAQVTIEADAWVLETAARILQTYLDRGPSSDRQGVAAIADKMLAVATDAQVDHGLPHFDANVSR